MILSNGPLYRRSFHRSRRQCGRRYLATTSTDLGAVITIGCVCQASIFASRVSDRPPVQQVHVAVPRFESRPLMPALQLYQRLFRYLRFQDRTRLEPPVRRRTTFRSISPRFRKHYGLTRSHHLVIVAPNAAVEYREGPAIRPRRCLMIAIRHRRNAIGIPLRCPPCMAVRPTRRIRSTENPCRTMGRCGGMQIVKRGLARTHGECARPTRPARLQTAPLRNPAATVGVSAANGGK